MRTYPLFFDWFLAVWIVGEWTCLYRQQRFGIENRTARYSNKDRRLESSIIWWDNGGVWVDWYSTIWLLYDEIKYSIGLIWFETIIMKGEDATNDI